MVYNEHPSRACAVCRPSWLKLRFRFNQQIANDEHLTAPLTIFTIPHDCQHVVESPNAGQLQTGAWNTSCKYQLLLFCLSYRFAFCARTWNLLPQQNYG